MARQDADGGVAVCPAVKPRRVSRLPAPLTKVRVRPAWLGKAAGLIEMKPRPPVAPNWKGLFGPLTTVEAVAGMASRAERLPA